MVTTTVAMNDDSDDHVFKQKNSNDEKEGAAGYKRFYRQQSLTIVEPLLERSITHPALAARLESLAGITLYIAR